MWDRLQSKADPTGSYKAYRQFLKESSSKGPCLPYLLPVLSDLTFIHEGNPNFLNRDWKLINFAKREMCSNIITHFLSHQHPKYRFPMTEPTRTFLTEFPHLTDKELYSLSLLRELRGPELFL